MTRWHFYDLVGYVLEESVHDWTVISLPAICDSDSDPLGRQFGEPLWPSRYPVKILHEIQSEVGTVEWNAQYQQRPLPAEGGMVELKWFQRYNQHQINMTEIGLRLGGTPNIPFNIEKIVLSWDTAFKESQLNDPSSCTVWGVAKDMNYLIEVFNKRMKYPELKRKAIELHEHYSRWGLGPVRVLIEDRASGQSLIQDLRHETQIPVIAMPASNDKKIRLSKVTPLMEAGKISLPEKAPWLVRYETQMAQFPYGKEDDDVDSTAHFLNWVSKPRFVRSRFPKFWK
jgi:predicted phage terminase large subunit-like protein